MVAKKTKTEERLINMTMELKKGDKAYAVRGAKVVEVVVSSVRVSKYGSVTFFVKTDYGKFECSFCGQGFQNFKTWRDAVWSRFNWRLVKSEDEVKKLVSANKKEAKLYK